MTDNWAPNASKFAVLIFFFKVNIETFIFGIVRTPLFLIASIFYAAVSLRITYYFILNLNARYY